MTFECREKDIAYLPNPRRVTVSFAGRVIADSVAAISVDEPGSPLRVYLPQADVDASVLVPSTHSSTCPYKGVASYFDLVSGDARSANAVWSYRDPCPNAESIRGHVAFWGDAIHYEQHER